MKDIQYFNNFCPVCRSTDLITEECLGDKWGKGFKKALTGECNECLSGFEVQSNKVTSVREGLIIKEGV